MHPHPSPAPTSAARRSTHVAQLLALLTAASLAIAPHSVRAQTVGTTSGTAYTTTDGFGPDAVPGCSHSFLNQPAGSTSCTSFDTSPTLATASSSGTNAIRTVRSQASTASIGPNQPYADAEASQFAKLSVSGSDPSASSLVFHFATDGMTSMAPGGLYSYAFWGLYLASSQQSVDGSGSVETNRAADGSVNETDSPNAHGNASGTEYDFTMPFNGSGGDVLYSFESRSAASLLYVTPSGSASLTATLAGIDAVNDQGQTIGTAVFGTDGNGTLVLTTSTTTAPEPSTLALLATGLVGIVPVARRRR